MKKRLYNKIFKQLITEYPLQKSMREEKIQREKLFCDKETVPNKTKLHAHNRDTK